MDENIEGIVSPLLQAACAMFEMFTTLMEAGFSERQALVICSEGIRPKE